jgi:glycogen debranching enzyme
MSEAGLRVPQPIMVLHGGGVALACGQDGRLQADEMNGLFAGDTRVLSTYRLEVGGKAWQLLGHSRAGYATASWEFQNQAIRQPGGEIPAGTLLLSLRRRLDGVLHDDLTLRSFGEAPLRLRLTVQLDADFADIFEVKSGSLPPRPNVGRTSSPAGLSLAYARGSFHRALRVTVRPSAGAPTFAGALIVFDLQLPRGGEWHCCLEAAPDIDGQILRPTADPHGPEPSPVVEERPLVVTSEPLLQRPFERGRADLHSLAVPQPGREPYVAAGVPWFLTLFGRDSLMAGLMAGLDGTWLAQGALAAVGELQAKRRDDWRDAEPGKLPHELRQGELARFRVVPHSPYYGTHDAPALYVLALWQAWRWGGDRSALAAHLATALAALRWCDELGDRDGDGFLEYGTRSPVGYRNQSWKDAGDAIVHEDGRQAEPPLATVEMQGYLYAARLAMAELQQELGAQAEAVRLRAQAEALRQAVERTFWLPEAGYYAVALDADKHTVKGIESNAAHLLWCGLPGRQRATAVAARLLRPDLFSGWGLRTLSADNPAYNPLAYQRGSVWPHDTLLAAAGLWRYGFRAEASVLIKAILEAAMVFEEERLPELFCGLPRAGRLPVPYLEANVPQAWAAAAPLLAVQLFLGLVPDAPRGHVYLQPWLPEWLPWLEVRGIRVGQGSLDVSLTRAGGRTRVEHLASRGVQVTEGTTAAPLWGEPHETSQRAFSWR